MKKNIIVQCLAIVISCFLLILTSCSNGYTSGEIEKMRKTLSGFENSQDFAITYFDTMCLQEKKIFVDELNYKGTEIDRLFGCADKYFYASIRTKNKKGEYTIRFLKVDYNTLEMVEFGFVEGLKENSTTSCRLVGDYLWFSDSEKYCTYNIESGESKWFEYNHEKFWVEEEGRYSFKIRERRVTITDTLTGAQKEVLFQEHLSTFPEGKFIQEFDSKLTKVSTYFMDATEKDGVCYLLAIIPLDSLVIESQAVIFAYDFESGKLSYYSNAPYDIYGSAKLTIINR